MDMKNPYIIDVRGLNLENFIVEEEAQDALEEITQQPAQEHEESLEIDLVQNTLYQENPAFVASTDPDHALSKTNHPFEFTKTKLWSESFFDTEESSNAIAALLQETKEIKQLVLEIRELLPHNISF